MIVHPSVTTEEAKTLFPEHTVHKVCHIKLNRNAPTDDPITAVPEDHPPQG